MPRATLEDHAFDAIPVRLNRPHRPRVERRPFRKPAELLHEELTLLRLIFPNLLGRLKPLIRRRPLVERRICSLLQPGIRIGRSLFLRLQTIDVFGRSRHTPDKTTNKNERGEFHSSSPLKMGISKADNSESIGTIMTATTQMPIRPAPRPRPHSTTISEAATPDTPTCRADWSTINWPDHHVALAFIRRGRGEQTLKLREQPGA